MGFPCCGGSDDDKRNREILYRFDMDMRYGPQNGISRKERYDKAVAEGLNPPKRVGELLKLEIYRADRRSEEK